MTSEERYRRSIAQHAANVAYVLECYPQSVAEQMRQMYRLDLYPIGFTVDEASRLEGRSHVN